MRFLSDVHNCRTTCIRMTTVQTRYGARDLCKSVDFSASPWRNSRRATGSSSSTPRQDSGDSSCGAANRAGDTIPRSCVPLVVDGDDELYCQTGQAGVPHHFAIVCIRRAVANGVLDTVNGNDVVFWGAVHAHHEPRPKAEESAFLPYHYAEFSITPHYFEVFRSPTGHG